MIEVAKSFKLQSYFYSARVIFPFPCAVYMYKIMILLNFSSETTWPVFTKFHVDPTVETGLTACSNGQAPLTVIPMYGKKIINKHILLQILELLKMIILL